VPGARHAEAEVEPGEPDREADGGADDRGGRAVGAGARGADDGGGAEKRRDRVEPLPEDDRDLPDEDVAQDPAADAGDRAEDDGRGGGDAVVEALRGAGDAEEREAGRVEQVDRARDPSERRMGEEGDEPGAPPRPPDSASRGTSPVGRRSAGRG
jgi:hypothetical protein